MPQLSKIGLNAIFLKNAISFRQGSIFASANSLHRQKS